MTRLCIGVYRYFRIHRCACWLSLGVLSALLGWCAMHIGLDEDIAQLLPSSKNADGSTKLAFANLKIKDKTFVLFEGSDPAAMAAACDAFMDSLATDTALVADAFYRLPADLPFDLADYLTAHLPSFVDTAVYARLDTMLTPEAMALQMERNRSDLLSPVGELLPELIETDPIGLRTLVTLPQAGGGGYTVIDGHFFVPDSSVCVAFVTPNFSATNTGDGQALFGRMEHLKALFAQTAPDVHISYHGTPAHGYHNARQTKHDLLLTIGGSLLLALILLALWFRRWQSIPLLLLPVVFGTLTGLAAMYLIKGRFSLMALGIGAVVLGVAMSYVLHVLVHHAQVRQMEQVLRDEVRPLCLGCITTIGSFAGLLFVKTELLRDFGLFAIFAVLGTVFFSLVYLPHMVCAPAGLPPSREDMSRRRSIAPLLGNRWGAYAILFLSAVCIAGCFAGGGAHFDSDMHHLGYRQPDVVRSEQLLREKTTTGNKQKHFASTGHTMEEALANFVLLSHRLDSLVQAGVAQSYTPTNRLFVPLATQQQRIDAWQRYWTAGRLERVRALVEATAPQAGLRPEAFEPFFSAATASYRPDAIYAADVLPRGILSVLMERSRDGQFLCFTSVCCADSNYQRLCRAVLEGAPTTLVLDTYYYAADTLRQMNDDFQLLQWLSMAFVLMVLLLSMRFRWLPALLAFMPILASWLIVLGAMNLFGVQFNLVSIVVSTFVFGIGVDYSIFVMNGLLCHDDGRMLARHATAVLLSAVVLVVTVGSMAFATHPAIRSVGFVTLVGLLAAVLLSCFVQPFIYKHLHSGEK